METAPVRILLVDDEKVIRDGCARALGCEEYEIHKAVDGLEGVACLERERFDVVLVDLMMPGMDGLEVLRWVKQNQPEVMVIVVTGFATVAKAVEAMKQGAFDFVGKPFTPDYIRLVVSRAVEQRELKQEAARLRQEHDLDLAAIAEEQSRLQTVFACMQGAILVTDSAGVVVLHNPAAIRMLEIQTDPVIGKPLGESIVDRGAVAMVQEVIDCGQSVTREFPPGAISRLYLLAHCAPVRTNGRVLGSVTVFEDITTHKQIDQHKSEFVAMVAHDLRSPLASVVQMIYAIRGCDDAERRTHLLERIGLRINDQLQMIENLLSLSRLETGALVLNLEPARCDKLLQDVVEVVRPKAEGKNIDLRLEECSGHWWVAVDHDQMRVVLTNIVDNAVKYTPEGGRVVVHSESKNSLASIQVADTGIGIAADDLPHIFDRFYRVKGKETRGITGSGLGLSLVQKVIEAHKGDVEVSSTPGEGTTFTVNLPLTEAPSDKKSECSE